jgi:energy-coupling factor transporter transmembrane protein EcfT
MLPGLSKIKILPGNYFEKQPSLGFVARLIFLIYFFVISIWSQTLVSLSFAATGVLLYRKICCHEFKGLGVELAGSFIFTITLVVLALPFSNQNVLQNYGTIWLRFFLLFSPPVTFARSLNPREAACKFKGYLPNYIIFSIEIALRFLPLLFKEALEVYSIQSSRKAFSHGSIKNRFKAFFIPFFVRLFRIADRVTYALKNREIDPNSSRKIVKVNKISSALEELKHNETTKPCR